MVLNIPPRDNVCSFSVGVDSESRDALLAEVQLLEATLGGIRQDLQGVMGCQGMCDRLDTLHETVSSLLCTVHALYQGLTLPFLFLTRPKAQVTWFVTP